MRPGDWVKQRFQHNASEQLVVAFLPGIALVVVWSRDKGYKWVSTSGYDVVREGSPVDRMRAEDLCRPKNLGCRQHLEWIFGSQVR